MIGLSVGVKGAATNESGCPTLEAGHEGVEEGGGGCARKEGRES